MATKIKIKKGDQVVVISGNSKNTTDPKNVLAVFRDDQRVLIEGVNLRWKHKKATQENPKGERVQEECPIHVSNVMLWDSSQNKAVRKRPATEN
ncbi:MAG: 50S ribosomal protein L24 [Planctomycetota bacterium]|jgi:large subunit ribosomal protein L24|nr:50S ribosomal protein L24 [Planctomycetota bacterium]MDG2142018.1 50S ribosomal protein L24 [Planctomycetota bacterium]